MTRAGLTLLFARLAFMPQRCRFDSCPWSSSETIISSLRFKRSDDQRVFESLSDGANFLMGNDYGQRHTMKK